MRSIRPLFWAILFVLVAAGCGDNAGTPPAGTCGDGVRDQGEACDEGDGNSDTLPDACRLDCSKPVCGDGTVDAGEECDDGPANGDDQACTATCKLPSVTCGDGVVDAGEECDDGPANSDTEPDACRTTCDRAGCGDGVIDTSESCDDGAANSDTAADACRTTCVEATCGDGAIDTGEACDDGAANSDTAPGACRTTCIAPTCGDGVIDTGEECDDGAANSDTAADACRTTCDSAGCGDGILDAGETCDDGAANSDTAADACRTSCQAASCGDGIVDAGEACDAGAANSDTAPDTCRTTCAAPSCGDGTVDASEQCDLGAANSDATGSTCFTTCRGLWKFVSMPDFLSFDIGDVSTLTGLVNSTNTYHQDAINFVLDSIAAENPDFVLVAGNLVGTNWHNDTDSVGVFGPIGTLTEQEAAIQAAGDTYYPQWLQRFALRGIPVHAAIGETDLGHAPWSLTFDRSHLVDDYKNVWAKHLTKLPGGAPRYADRPVGTAYENTAYAFRHKNMLVVTADVFHFEDGVDLGTQGSVALDVTPEQITWLNQVFTAAAADPSIEYLVVQGNVPVIKPVRNQASSNLGLDGGTTSPFWSALAAAGVDLYLAGDVHAMSATGSDGVEQVCHGGLMGSPESRTVSYLVGSVYPDRVELELKWIELAYNPANTSLLWQTGPDRPRAELYVDEANGFTTAGTMVIDHSGPAPVIRDRTGYFLRFGEQPRPGLIVHLPLDAAQGGRTTNLGFSTALNNGTLTGGTIAPGKLGNALTLSAVAPTAPLEGVVAGATPISSSWPRTVSVWVKPSPGINTLSTVMTFGKNSSGSKWDMDIDAVNNGVVELGVAGGRTDGAGSTSVTDGAWHLITMVLPTGASHLDEVLIYVDGVAISSTAPTTVIRTAAEAADQNATTLSQLLLGRSPNANTPQPYVGELDDVAIWSRDLGAAEIRALASLANTAGLAYDAGQVDTLLTAFAAQQSVTIGTRTWTYQASGLTGTAGVVVEPVAGSYELNLGGGAGFVSP